MATSPSPRPRYVALIRGINVGGRNRVPMKDLTALIEGLGFTEVTTYLQSGNVTFLSDAPARTLESKLERAIASRFGIDVPVIIRTSRAFAGSLRRVPWKGLANREPSRVLVYHTKRPVLRSAQSDLEFRARARERVAVVQDVLWIHFPDGIARSKLTPAVIDDAAGSPATGRNWNTASKLVERSAR